MQGQDIRGNGEPTVPASLPQLPTPYVYKGLTVEGVSPDRLTPRMNENIIVPDEVGRTIVARNLVRRFTESRIAIALVGLGLPPEAPTVRAHVRAMIITAGLARAAATLRARELTPKPALRSEPSEFAGIRGVPGHDVGKGTGGVHVVDDEVEL